jgi:hypothetical protein
MREKGTTTLGAQQYQQALTVYAFQQGQSIAIKYRNCFYCHHRNTRGESQKDSLGKRGQRFWGFWVNVHYYIYISSTRFSFVHSRFFLSIYTQDSRHTYCDLLFFVLLSFSSPFLLCTRIVISLPPIPSCTTCILANEARLLPSV